MMDMTTQTRTNIQSATNKVYLIYLHCIFLFTLFADLANEFDSFFVGIDFIVDKGNWIVNEMEEEGLRIALDKLSNVDGLKYDIKEVSNGTFESLEKGDISANEI